MSLGTTAAVALEGLIGHVVEVQAQLAFTVPGFTLVGLPDAALVEAKDRVRAAVLSRNLEWPNRKITVNLSPAALPKTGTAFDLAIAVAILIGARVIPDTQQRRVHLAELGLDGRLQPVRGILPMVAAAVAAGVPDVVVATASAAEAKLVPGARVQGADTLSDVVALHGGKPPTCKPLPPASAPRVAQRLEKAADLSDVIGQEVPKLAVEIAAAGGHHLLLCGPPGAGKTMLAARIPSILPSLTQAEAVEVTSIHSVAGTFDPGQGLVLRPPFEDPHHTATPAAIVGGGSGVPRPGAASRAHCGVLFLDEAPEFSARVLEALRQPLEHGELVIQRGGGMARFPARFQLVLAANPCPCGMGGGKGLKCTCTPMARRRYFSKLSGPLLDRVDLQVQVDPVSRAGLLGQGQVSSKQVAARVAVARAQAASRLKGTPWQLNSQVPGKWLRERYAGRPEITRELFRALDAGLVSLRGADRVLRIAQTIADLNDREYPTATDAGLAMMLRTGRGH
ncbi:MAG: YifB family Mg chelatase-like AAA ATPase [Cellulomonadaceae bacterium]|jgi:magnesium chelatase family protein|nr:YifB family Mg chelatase-like AAA ATPase [Cellulomonadaceae bacterium]